MIPLRNSLRQRRLRFPMLWMTGWTLTLAGIVLALLIWQIGAPWVAVLIGGSGALLSAAGGWWQWATRQCPPRRPTLFVIRHRQHQAMRLLRSVEADLSRHIEMVEMLVRQVDAMDGSVNDDHDRGRRGEGV
ncbi:hypothetical protein [Roseiflexus sp.]|uniref:hypothetical protein n=1 Tax=Roseiflexus sp. TaxID=2562120 RepID=UPI002583EA2A|nr:hypothetical protein [Roseiflexus sp.]